VRTVKPLQAFLNLIFLPLDSAAAMATGCEIEVNHYGQAFDLRQNKALGRSSKWEFSSHTDYSISFPGDEVANIVLNKYGSIDYEWGIKSASTDFVR
jgi:hypothetical protein